jgi:hypothetical protein
MDRLKRFGAGAMLMNTMQMMEKRDDGRSWNKQMIGHETWEDLWAAAISPGLAGNSEYYEVASQCNACAAVMHIVLQQPTSHTLGTLRICRDCQGGTQ